MAIKKYTREDLEKMDDKTDYNRVSNLTEEEIIENAKSDPDVPLQSDKDLEKFHRIKLTKGGRHDKNKGK